MKKTLLQLCLLLLLTPATFAQNNELIIKINNVESSDGNILYAIYDDSKLFNNGKDFVYSGVIKAKEGETIIVLRDIPDGVYAISVFHDKNDNKKMDFNLFGIPKEGFGFSENPKIMFGAPSFEDCSFKKSGKSVKQISLKHFL